LPSSSTRWVEEQSSSSWWVASRHRHPGCRRHSPSPAVGSTGPPTCTPRSARCPTRPSHAYRRPSSYSPPAGGPRATPTCNAWSPLPRGWTQRLPPRGGGATRRHCVVGPDRCSCRARSDQRISESRPTRVTVQISVTDWTSEERPPLVVQGRSPSVSVHGCGRYPQMPSFGWVEGSGQDRKDCRLQQPECGATTDPPPRGRCSRGPGPPEIYPVPPGRM
jgi:hypothetical protein